jgi:hypothetical protein
LKQFEDIPLSKLKLDTRFQHRVEELDDERVDQIAACLDIILADNPPVVFREGKINHFPDGHYRYSAAEQLGRKSIRCEVREGTLEDAFVYSLGANKCNAGLEMSQKDKRRAVRNAQQYRTEHHTDWSDRDIASMIGVSNGFVSDLRVEGEELSSNDTPESELDGNEDVPPDARGELIVLASRQIEGLSKTLYSLGIYDSCRRELQKLKHATEGLALQAREKEA